MSANTPKISLKTRADILQINFPQNDEKAWWNVFQIIAFELAVANSGNIERHTCDQRSICQQTLLRFNLALGEKFLKSTFFRMMEKHDKISLVEVSASIWDYFTCWLSKRFLKHRFLKSPLTKIFTVCNFGNRLAMTSILFFRMFKIYVDAKNGTKNREKVFSISNNCIWNVTRKF